MLKANLKDISHEIPSLALPPGSRNKLLMKNIEMYHQTYKTAYAIRIRHQVQKIKSNQWK